MLVDSHAHLSHPDLVNDLDKIISDSLSNDVFKIVTIGCSIAEAQKSLEIAEKYEDVYATAGLYPRDSKSEANLSLDQKLAIIEELAMNLKIVAIGECGLDFSPVHEDEIETSRDEQFERFEKQIALAQKLNKPLIIHSRNAIEDTLEITNKYKGTLKAVWHCFSESKEVAEKALDAGLNISFTGNITYPKNIELREAVKYVPLDRIMIETDCPYLTPSNARKAKVKVNTPQYVKMVAEEIASIKGISLDEVAEQTTSNALKFYSF
jgi:TatD DNase family protein